MSVFKAPTGPPVVVPGYKIIRHAGRTNELFFGCIMSGLAATAGFILELQLFKKKKKEKKNKSDTKSSMWHFGPNKTCSVRY